MMFDLGYLSLVCKYFVENFASMFIREIDLQHLILGLRVQCQVFTGFVEWVWSFFFFYLFCGECWNMLYQIFLCLRSLVEFSHKHLWSLTFLCEETINCCFNYFHLMDLFRLLIPFSFNFVLLYIFRNVNIFLYFHISFKRHAMSYRFHQSLF